MALHYATAKSRQQALLKWIWQSPRIPQCKRFLKMFLPPSSGSVILSLARLRTLDRAFSSGGERFPDTEEVRSSNLLTPTKCSQLRGYVLWAVLFYVAKSAGCSNRPSNHPAHAQNRVNSHRGRGQRVSNPSEPQLLSKTPRCLRPAVSLSHLHLQHQGATMRTELDVPFSHKEEAKALGAK